MQDMRKPAIGVALLAAIGIGCYTWGQHKAADSTATVPSPYPTATQPPVLNQPNGNLPTVVNPGSMADQTNSVTTTRNNPGSPTLTQTTSTASTVPVVPGSPVTQMQVNPNAPQAPGYAPTVPGQPVAAVPYAGTTTVTPIESTTTVEKKTVVTPTHTAYTQHTVHYRHHKTDKVHIARATKHGVMFALKLPGRASF
jgi:hypothetical protein